MGDDSQSIYAFRGAQIQNILNFQKDYPESKIIRLERNYRSTRNIVDAANSVIAHNEGRIPKKCFSEGESGEKIRLIKSYTEQEEAVQIVSGIITRVMQEKAEYSDFAVLYRTNSQSRALEEAFRRKNIPYMIYSGNSFFERAEIKDMMAWFKLCVNVNDDESFKRVDAQSFGFAAHELVWRPTSDGSLDVTFVKVPLQFFENRTGALRYLPDPNLYDGVEMAEGEWMVTAGAGVGIAAAVAACSKRLSLQDWLLFSERCGQPGLHAATDAKQGSEQWNNLVAAVANFGREWGIVTDMATKVDTVSLANGGTPPYPALVERMDRAIAVLYRGSDLSTLSAGDGSVGASQQGEEADILEQDACEMLSETLQEQVERPFIRYVFGDEEPLAYVQVSPVSHPNLEMEMKIDQHLASLGVKLSKKEALERYQRTEASEDDPDDEPLKLAQPPAGAPGGVPGGGFGLPNEAPAPQDRENAIAKPLQNARSGSDGKSPDPTPAPALKRVLAAFRSDLGPAAEELQKVLDLPEDEMRAACKDLADRLPDLLPKDPAMASILAEELAGAFAEAVGETGEHGKDGEGLANEQDAQGHEHAPAGSSEGGRFVSKDGGGSAGSAPSDPKKEDGEKKSDYTDEQRKKVGERGAWDTLGLPPLRDLTPDEPVSKTEIAEAMRRIQAGETVKNPFGEELAVDQRAFKHLTKKGRDQAELRTRLAELDFAEETVRHPHEIWMDESNGRRKYVRYTKIDGGRKVINAVDETTDHVYSWHSNAYSLDHYRNGRLLYVRP